MRCAIRLRVAFLVLVGLGIYIYILSNLGRNLLREASDKSRQSSEGDGVVEHSELHAKVSQEDTPDEALPEEKVSTGATVKGADGGGDVTTSGPPCLGPTLPPPAADAEKLRAKIRKVTKDWGYDDLAYSYKPFSGMKLLDIGMGQGPMGVVAISVGVKSYKGMDPALCINQHALTRDKTVGRAPNPLECELLRDSKECKNQGEHCKMYESCMTLAAKKYRAFPYTGLEIMQAYAGQIVLLPGTFATLQPSGLIKPGTFEVATMWMVTEHLPNNRAVVEGIFQWTKPGDLLALKHHNYYGFDGHHQKPRYPEQHDPHNVAERGVVFWKHLDPQSWVFNYTNTNRIRLGDIIALIDVYFECAWRANVEAAWENVLDAERLSKFQKRGFSRSELVINKWTAACLRRNEALDAPWLDTRMWLHPPTDGSYEPRPLPEKLMSKVHGQVSHTPSGKSHLKRYLIP